MLISFDTPVLRESIMTLINHTLEYQIEEVSGPLTHYLYMDRRETLNRLLTLLDTTVKPNDQEALDLIIRIDCEELTRSLLDTVFNKGDVEFKSQFLVLKGLKRLPHRFLDLVELLPDRFEDIFRTERDYNTGSIDVYVARIKDPVILRNWVDYVLKETGFDKWKTGNYLFAMYVENRCTMLPLFKELGVPIPNSVFCEKLARIYLQLDSPEYEITQDEHVIERWFMLRPDYALALNNVNGEMFHKVIRKREFKEHVVKPEFAHARQELLDMVKPLVCLQESTGQSDQALSELLDVLVQGRGMYDHTTS